MTNRRLNEATAKPRTGTRAVDPAPANGQGRLAPGGSSRAHRARTGPTRRRAVQRLTNSDYKEAIAEVRDEVAKGNIEKAKDLLDQQQKALDEKDNDAEWYQMQHALLDVRQQLADARDRQVDKNNNKAKPGQSVAIESRKAAALQKAKTAYDRETELAGSDPEARKTADDNFKQAQQDAQDAYEAEINAAGGDATHQDVESWRGKAATPPASTAAPAAGTKPAAQSDNGVPTTMGPKGETPAKTASDGKVKIGFYKSTNQWMLVPSGGQH